MKRGFWILLVALLAGVIGFVITRRQCDCNLPEAALTHDGATMLPELKWLRRELDLTDAQFAEVSGLHLAYRPSCEALCEKVAATRQRVQAMVAAGDVDSPQLAAALREQAAVRVECQTTLLKHLHQTAAAMSPEQGRRYLKSMLPQVIGAEAAPMPSAH